MFTRKPEHGTYSKPTVWRELQQRAFGSSFVDYFETLVLPFVSMTIAWGTIGRDGKLIDPELQLDRYFNGTQVDPAAGSAFLRSLTMDRDQFRAVLQRHVRKDGLPHAPIAFIKAPLVDVGDGWAIASSPWAVREYLRGGIWSKFLKASKEMDGPDEGPQIFTGDFGIAFELTCRDLAREAKAHPKFIGALELSKAPGTQDEIEDVVFREGDSAALFSAKARLMKEPVARQAIERSKVIEWYYEFFFDKKTVKKGKKFRVGVLRLLDLKVDALLASSSPPSRIFPVLLSYDHLGENAALYEWLDEQCKKLNLLQHPTVQPLTLMEMDDYEALLKLAADGRSIIDLLAQKVGPKWRLGRMTSFVHELGKGVPMRLPSFETHFQQITDATSMRLFGQKPQT